MRTRLAVASLALACTAPQPTPGGHEPAANPPAATTPGDPEPAAITPVVTTPAATTPAVTTPAVTTPVVTPAPAPNLQVGPDRWQLPRKLECDRSEPGPFCGVYILDIAGGPPTTLVSRDGATWALRDGKDEAPTAVEFVDVPPPPALLKRAEPLFRSGPGAFVSVTPTHPILPETFMLADVRWLSSDFVLHGDRLLAIGDTGDTALLAIDPAARTARPIALPRGKTPLDLFPAGPNLALYLSGKRGKSVAILDVAGGELTAEVVVPRDLEPACLRTRHYYDEAQVSFVPTSGKFYVGFSCFPDA